MRFNLMEEQGGKTKIISSGLFGLLIYNDDGSISHHFESDTNRDFAGQFVDA